MSSRRDFLKQAAVTSLIAATPLQVACPTSATNPARRIKAVVRREETTLRLGGEGDNFHMTWMANDRQLVVVDDGYGWIDAPQDIYNARLFTVGGETASARFDALPSFPAKSAYTPPTSRGADWPYHGYGVLAVDSYVYLFLNAMFRGAKLVYSPDHGRTWRNQNGGPVAWETKQQQSRETLVFYEEPQKVFSLLTVLQMGKNYEHNRDGYIYVYSPNGVTEGTMNQLAMFRAPKARILDRRAYEYFSGLRSDGSANWVTDIEARGVVHSFPRGWVNAIVTGHPSHPYAWQPSVVYNAPLGLYMMANWGMGCAPDGTWFGKPSYLGFWTAPNPWGPWTQIHEETAWLPANDAAARAYQPQIAPKWIARDGKSFWLVWTDWQQSAEFEPLMLEAIRSPTQAQYMRLMQRARQHRPYYGFNTQRVDLIVA